MSDDQDILNIINLELQLKETMNELQWKSKILEESQQQLLQVRQELLNKEVDLEDKERSINDLKMQLTSAHRVIEWIEKEKAKYMNERIQLQINCDAAVKERESLLEQTHSAKLENMTLKLNVQQLTEAVAANESIKKSLEAALLQMQERFSQVNNSLQSNIAKLEKEHKLLMKSVESTTQLNKRLQTVGLCTHAIYSKKNEEIKELKKELVLKTQEGIPPQINFNNEVFYSHRTSTFDAKAYMEQVHMDLEKYVAVDKEVEAFLTEFETD